MVPEIKTFCQTFGNSPGITLELLHARLEERLGLPPESRYEYFVEFLVEDPLKMAYPNGAPFQKKDNERARMAAWSPKYEHKNVAAVNDGLGCIMFITKDGSDIPSLCAPVDVQANLAMEAREDWENGRRVPDGKNEMLSSIVNSIPSLWAEENTLYCLLRPKEKYIDLNDTLQSCTPEKVR